MGGKPVKVTGPDRPITVSQFDGQVAVRAGGKLIAEPAARVPHKGDASNLGEPTGDTGRNGVWTCEMPYAAVAGIKDHLIFYSEDWDRDAPQACVNVRRKPPWPASPPSTG